MDDVPYTYFYEKLAAYNYNTTGIINSLSDKCGNLIDWFLKHNIHNPVIIGNNGHNFTPHSFNVRKMYVFIDDITKINSTLYNIDTYNIFASNGQYFFILCEIFNEAWIHQISEMIWQHSLINFVFIYYINQLNVIGYNPFNKTILNFTETYSDENLFPDKFLDLYGYELRVSISEDVPRNFYENEKFYGLDGNLFTLIIEDWNATVKFTYHINLKDAVEDLDEKRTDFCFVGVIAVNNILLYDYTYPPYMDDLIILVPKLGLIPNYLHILLIFNDSSWVIMLFAFLSLVFITYLIKRKQMNTHYTIGNSGMEIMSIILSIPLPTYLKNITAIKLLFLACFMSAVIISSLLQSKLITTYIQPKQYQEIETLQELELTKLPIYMSTYYRDYLEENRVMKSTVVNVTKPEVINYVRNGYTNGSFALLYSYAWSIMYGTRASIKRQEQLTLRKTYTILKEHLIPGDKIYLFPKRSPYVQNVNKILRQDREYMLTNTMTFKANLEKAAQVDKFVVLGMMHFLGNFYLLLFGITISIFIFLGEIVYFNWNKIT